MTPVFELQDVHVEKDGHAVLQGVSLSLQEGARLSLVGPSGGGKSTLLRLLVGLDAPSRGSACYAGEPIEGPRVAEVRANVGYVIQEGALLPHLTAAQNIALPARVAGWDPERTRRRVQQLQQLVRLPGSLLRRYPGELSGGQRQRVALMRALCTEPRALLLDEPLGALDPVVRRELQDELLGIFEATGTSVLLVSHDLEEAAFLGQALAVIETGRVVQVGDLETLRAAPATPHVRAMLKAGAPR